MFSLFYKVTNHILWLRSLTFFTAGRRRDPKFFSSNSEIIYLTLYHQCIIMITYFFSIKLEKNYM